MAHTSQVLYPHMQGKGPFSVEAKGYKKVDGETIPRVNVAAKDGLISNPSEDVRTIVDILKRSADKFGNAKALGWRDLVRTHQETKKVKKMIDGKSQEVEKKWTYFELSEYTYMSFVEYERMALQIGAGLRKIGMSAGDKVHLFGATR